MSSLGIVPPTTTMTSLGALLLQQLDDPRHERHVGAGEDREADRVGVLLERGLDDLLGRLVQARVDDLHAGVAQRAGDDLRPAVVPVEARLGDDDADLAAVHAGQNSPETRATNRCGPPGGPARPRCGGAGTPPAPVSARPRTAMPPASKPVDGSAGPLSAAVPLEPLVPLLPVEPLEPLSEPFGRPSDGVIVPFMNGAACSVAERAGLAERVRAAAALGEHAGVEAAVVGSRRVTGRPVVAPGHRVADVHGHVARRELEVADRHSGGGRARSRSSFFSGFCTAASSFSTGWAEAAAGSAGAAAGAAGARGRSCGCCWGRRRRRGRRRSGCAEPARRLWLPSCRPADQAPPKRRSERPEPAQRLARTAR